MWPILCNPMDYRPPGSSVHGSFQARVLRWVAMSIQKTKIMASGPITSWVNPFLTVVRLTFPWGCLHIDLSENTLFPWLSAHLLLREQCQHLVLWIARNYNSWILPAQQRSEDFFLLLEGPIFSVDGAGLHDVLENYIHALVCSCS